MLGSSEACARFFLSRPSGFERKSGLFCSCRAILIPGTLANGTFRIWPGFRFYHGPTDFLAQAWARAAQADSPLTRERLSSAVKAPKKRWKRSSPLSTARASTTRRNCPFSSLNSFR